MRRAMIFCLLFFLVFPGSISHASASDYSEINVSEEDIELIIRLTHFETEGEPLLCKCAFAAVVFNRIKDGCFPANARDVVYSKGAFEATGRKDFTAALSEDKTTDDEIAVRYVFEKGIDPTCGALFVMKRGNVHLWEIQPTFQIGDFVFGNIP